MTTESFKISEIGNDLAQWPELDFVSKEGLQRIAKFVLSEVALAERAARVEVAKEILEYGIPNAMTSMDTSGEMKNRCKDIIAQAEKTDA